MNPEQKAAIERARQRAAQRAPSPEQQRAIAAARERLYTEQSDAALEPGSRVPPGFVLNPATGQMENLRNPDNLRVRDGQFAGGMSGLGQGVTFGFADELNGVLNRAVNGGGADAQNYGTEVAREELRRGRENYPITTSGAEVVGAVAGGLGAGGLAARGLRGASTRARVGAATGVGAAEGGLYGLGAAEGDLRERGADAFKGALVGAGIGIAAEPVGQALMATGRAVKAPIVGALGKPSPDRANRALAQTVDRSGQTMDDLRNYLESARADGQPEAMVADALGYEGQRALSGMARSVGDGRRQIVETLDARQADQAGRVGGFVEDAFGAPRTAMQETASLETARREAANRNYGVARGEAQPVNIDGPLAYIDDRIGGMQGSGVKGSPSDVELASWRARMESEPDADGTTRMLSDFDRLVRLKSDLGGRITELRRAGNEPVAASLIGLQNQLDEALSAASDNFRRANDTFAADSFAISQIEAGQQAARPQARAADVADQFNAIPNDPRAPDLSLPAIPGQPVPRNPQDMFRAGYADRVLSRVENSAPGVDTSRPLRTGRSSVIADAIANNPDLLRRRLDREATMFETRRQATGGSLTANNQADSAALEGANLGPVVQTGRDLLNFNAGNVLERAAMAAGGQNEATRRLLAELLMSRNADNVINAVAQTQGNDVARQTLLSAIVRNAANRPAVDALR